MKYILSPPGLETLTHFTSTNVLLAFDYDGTLSPIVVEPAHAEMRARTRALLAALTARYPCAIISGRERSDVCARLGDVAVRAIIGNHGGEPLPDAPPPGEVQQWRSTLAVTLSRVDGVEVEDKHLSLSVHYRRSPDKRRARAAILHAVESLDHVCVIRGKQVVNVLPAGLPHKGSALTALCEREGCDTAVYVGDDETDEDVFGLAQPDRILGIRVGEKRSSRAEYYVRNQADVDHLLRELLLRPESDEPHGFGETRSVGEERLI